MHTNDTEHAARCWVQESCLNRGGNVMRHKSLKSPRMSRTTVPRLMMARSKFLVIQFICMLSCGMILVPSFGSVFPCRATCTVPSDSKATSRELFIRLCNGDDSKLSKSVWTCKNNVFECSHETWIVLIVLGCVTRHWRLQSDTCRLHREFCASSRPKLKRKVAKSLTKDRISVE